MSYTRFVIISHLRSGTHLLRTLLESHPRVVCQSEVFNSDSPRLPYSLETPTRELLDQWVYHQFPPEIHCAGFVLQAYHPGGLKAFPGIRENPLWDDVWTELQNMPDLRVIHLRRENSLRRYLSHMLARRTGTWHDWNKHRIDDVTHIEQPVLTIVDRNSRPRIHLAAEHLAVDFEDVASLHDRISKCFKGRAYFPLTYEDLVANRDRMTKELLAFLKLEPARLRAAVKKIETRALRDSILNFEELKTRFADSRWQSYFED